MIVTPQFLGVATENGKVELQSITCRDEDSDLVILSTLESHGVIVKSYFWVNYGGESGEESCWLDGDTMEKPTEPVYFEPGQALWIEGKSDANTVVSSGKVGTADVAVQLQNGATLTGNFTPVSINLQDVLCRYDDSDQVILNTLESHGIIVKSYFWVNYGGESGEESCWLDGDTMEKPTENVMLDPGAGLWVEGKSSENVVTFPGVEL